jgi:transcriptional regulator GlxA family with amidase domain
MNTLPQALQQADALHARLLAHIDAQLDSTALTPRTAAQALGVSVRRLHGLLAGSPHTFSRLVARRRLRRAQGLLAQCGASVADVAFACGFNSLATFYRQYTAAFGVSPAGRRRRSGASPETWTPQGQPRAR